jgi:hypothetical protein
MLHGLINYIDTKAKCRPYKKLTFKGTLRQVLGWPNNFVVSESGQIQSGKLLQNMVPNRTQHLPPPPSHTLYILYFDTGEGEG